MREAADGLRRAVGGSLQRLQQLSAGDLHDAQGIAEGQDGVDVLLGDVALGNGCADAAAVGHGRVHLGSGLLGAPDQSVGNEVAQVGLAGADLGLHAVQLHFSLGKHGAVLVINRLLDGGSPVGHGAVGLHSNVSGGDGGCLHDAVGDDHQADVFKLGAGRGQDGIVHHAVLTHSSGDGFQVRMGVAVDEEVDAVHFLQKVHGAVAGGLIVDAQVAQAHDNIAALGLQLIYLLLSAGKQLVVRQEGDALDLGGVGLGGRLRGVQAENADLGAVRRGEGHVVIERGLAAVEHVGRHNGEIRLAGQFLQVGIAVIELVVAGGSHIVTGQVHQFHRSGTLAGADSGITLDKVTGVHQQNVGTHVLIGLLQRRRFGIAIDGTVHVIGVQDDDGAAQVLGGFLGADGDAQGEHHGQNQEQ